MGTHPFIADLQFAQTAQVAVDIRLRSGVHLPTAGVADVDVEDGLVSLHDPQHFGDSTTRRRLSIGEIVSLTVTNIEYRF